MLIIDIGLIMASAASVEKELEVLGATGQGEMLSYLEGIIVLGSFATEVTKEVKKNQFFKGKVYHHCGMRKY
jgi:hypothetical protein